MYTNALAQITPIWRSWVVKHNSKTAGRIEWFAKLTLIIIFKSTLVNNKEDGIIIILGYARK